MLLIQVKFRGKEGKPLQFGLNLFDFTANELSRSLEPFVKEKTSFCERANGIINKEQQEKLAEHQSVIEISDEMPPSLEEILNPVPPTRTETVGEKRRLSKEFLPVDPLPPTIKRQKLSSADENSAYDETFLARVKREFLIKEGMQFVFIFIL